MLCKKNGDSYANYCIMKQTNRILLTLINSLHYYLHCNTKDACTYTRISVVISGISLSSHASQKHDGFVAVDGTLPPIADLQILVLRNLSAGCPLHTCWLAINVCTVYLFQATFQNFN